MVEGWYISSPQMNLEYPYHGVDFSGDTGIGIPTNDAWGPVSM